MNPRFLMSFEAILEGLRRVGGAYWLHFVRFWRIWAAFVWIGMNVYCDADFFFLKICGGHLGQKGKFVEKIRA